MADRTIGAGMIIVGGDADVRHVLSHPEIFSSGIDAVAIGQVRPLIPLQIDPPEHKNFRKLLDPIFAPRQVALLEDQTRALVARPDRAARRRRAAATSTRPSPSRCPPPSSSSCWACPCRGPRSSSR